MGLKLEVGNAIINRYAECAENIISRQELVVLKAEQGERKVRYKKASKAAKAQSKKEAKEAKAARRNESRVNVSQSSAESGRSAMYSSMFPPRQSHAARRSAEATHMMYGSHFWVNDME